MKVCVCLYSILSLQSFVDLTLYFASSSIYLNLVDIMSYARAWTGFSSTGERGGVSVAERQVNDKIIDPSELTLDR